MSIAQDVLQRVQQSLSGTRLSGDVLVVIPTKHIVRGFLFERTTEKGMYYFWRLVMPLYRPTNSIYLNYSVKLPGTAEKFRLTKDTLQDVSDRPQQVNISKCLPKVTTNGQP
jgi:hypothetical protein